MANEGREFSFSTRRVAVGESDFRLGPDGQRTALLGDISSHTNAKFDQGVIKPNYTPSLSNQNKVHEYFASGLDESDSQAVQSFPDSIGSNDLTGGDPTVRTGEIGGQDALEWDGASDSLSGAAANYGSEFTIHAVWKVNSLDGSTNSTVYNSGDAGANLQIKPSSGTVQLGLSGVTSLGEFSISTGATVMSAKKPSGSVPDVLINGTSATGSSSTDPSPSGSSYMGSFNGTERYMRDFIGAVVVYDAPQSDTVFSDDHQKLRNFYGA